jgi:lycopene beta-cyclase
VGKKRVSERTFDYDCIFVGGGVANCLLAYWVKQKFPGIKLVIIEKDHSLGGNHTWSFHQTDVSKKDFSILAPFISKKWEGYSVAFPKYRRELSTPYLSIRSEDLDTKIRAEVPVMFGVEVTGVAPHNVTGLGGQHWSARCVFDGRGFNPVHPQMVGYQKFVGLEVELENPHGLSKPMLMDATCEQKDGFRFFYALPWSETRLLVEDTRYSDSAHLSVEDFRQEIKTYCEKKGWKIASVLREEVGALPIPLRARYLPMDKGFPEIWAQRLVPSVGVRGGFFHSTTGYSLPDHVRLIQRVVQLDLVHRVVFPDLVRLGRKTAKRQWFFRLLNRMIFVGSRPEERYRILQFFYRMPRGLINRFYSGHLWPTDFLRIFMGRPPISVKAALKCLVHYRETENV